MQMNYFLFKASWLLLAEVSQFSVEMDSKFIYDNWQKYSGDVTVETGSPLIQILITIGNVARRLSRIAVEDIRGTSTCTCTCNYALCFSDAILFLCLLHVQCAYSNTS